MQSRYYDPELGRFINADALVSTGQGTLGNNMFAYCLNNPTCLRDSAGLIPTEAVDTDGDGVVDYYRYEYTYTYVYYENDVIKSVIITGNVYYFPDIGTPKNLDTSDYPKGFKPWSDIMVGDYIQVKENHINPVLYAYQAQHLHIQAYSKAIECMLQIDEDFGLELNRSSSSMMTEWVSHMILLGKLGLSRTANIDFDRDSEDLRFFDYLKLAIQETFKIETGK